MSVAPFIVFQQDHNEASSGYIGKQRTSSLGLFYAKKDRVIGWVGLLKYESAAERVYGWYGSIKKEEIMSEELSPRITPLLVHPDERGNRYGKLLLEYA